MSETERSTPAAAGPPHTAPVDLSPIVKAYDVRGTVPDQINVEVAHALGVGFARFADAPRILVGRDMRPSGPDLVDAFARGVMEQGVDVVDLGLASTDLVYYAAGTLDAPGAVFTASHNPASYNGVKFCLSGARPVGQDTGLFDVRDIAQSVLDGSGPAARRARRLVVVAQPVVGVRRSRGLVHRHHRAAARCAWSPTPPTAWVVWWCRPCSNASRSSRSRSCTANSTARSRTTPPIRLQPENQRDLQARVVSGGFDLGLAFDGDADRVFVVDESGRGLSGSTTTAMLAATILRSHPGATILHNLICSRAVPEVVREHGGVPVRTKVGHSFIKQVMAETGAVFGGEHSAHYYFLDNFRADSGLIASMFVLDELSRMHSDLSVVRKPYERYSASGEINTHVDDPVAVIERVAAAFSHATQDRLDGLTVDCGPWWFNLRPSNTEPLAAPEPRGPRSQRVRSARGRGAGADHQRVSRSAHRRPTLSASKSARLRSNPTITKGGGSVTSEPGTLDPRLLAVLACPQDKGPLYYLGDDGGLYNPRLRRRYQVRDGIPVMLIDEAETLDQAAHDRSWLASPPRASSPPSPRRPRGTREHRELYSPLHGVVSHFSWSKLRRSHRRLAKVALAALVGSLIVPVSPIHAPVASAAGLGAGGEYHPLAPHRIYDSRASCHP